MNTLNTGISLMLRKHLERIAVVSLIATQSSSAFAALTQWRVDQGGNGHFYEVVNTGSSITWTAAKAAAEQRGGSLATITTVAEDAFVQTLLADPVVWGTDNGANPGQWGPWIGGWQPDQTSAPAAGWVWLTGENWSYTNWNQGEPNDGAWRYMRYESFLHYSRGPGNTFAWNDMTDDGHYVIQAFVLEVVPAPATALVLSFACRLDRRRKIGVRS